MSGLLLFVSFPLFGLFFLSWISLVPLLIAVSGKGICRGSLISIFSGIIFFLGIFSWILEVPGYTYLHHALLAVYLGLYIGVFGFIFVLFNKRVGLIAALFMAPFIWTLLEFLRSNFTFLELPWGLLSHAQYKNPVVIQIASLTGAYGVSFLIVLVNATIAVLVMMAFKRLIGGKANFPALRPVWARNLLLVFCSVCLVGTLLYGHWRLHQPIEGTSIKIAVIQGNIPQKRKWDRKYAKFIRQTYQDLTIQAARDAPSLIVWPETATPGAINRHIGMYSWLKGIASTADAYLLVGSAQRAKFAKTEVDRARYVNSAFLISPASKKIKNQRYDKILLFPFGEYLPYRNIIPWAWLNVPDVNGYMPGQEFKVLNLAGTPFAVTICWENIFPDLARRFVQNGAQFIVNITNEAWFGETAAPAQFLSMNVFRAVENGVYVVRCGNTGISCFIDPCGRVVDRVKNENGKDIFVRGFVTGNVVPLESNTIYTHYGYWFSWICVIISILFFLCALVKPKSRNLLVSERRSS